MSPLPPPPPYQPPYHPTTSSHYHHVTLSPAPFSKPTPLLFYHLSATLTLLPPLSSPTTTPPSYPAPSHPPTPTDPSTKANVHFFILFPHHSTYPAMYPHQPLRHHLTTLLSCPFINPNTPFYQTQRPLNSSFYSPTTPLTQPCTTHPPPPHHPTILPLHPTHPNTPFYQTQRPLNSSFYSPTTPLTQPCTPTHPPPPPPHHPTTILPLHTHPPQHTLLPKPTSIFPILFPHLSEYPHQPLRHHLLPSHHSSPPPPPPLPSSSAKHPLPSHNCPCSVSHFTDQQHQLSAAW